MNENGTTRTSSSPSCSYCSEDSRCSTAASHQRSSFLSAANFALQHPSMTEFFRQWQSRLHNPQQNVVDSQAIQGAEDMSQLNSVAQLDEAEFQRLMNEPMPMQSQTLRCSQVRVGQVQSEGNPAYFSLPQVSLQQTLPPSKYQHEAFPQGNSQPTETGRTPLSKKRTSKAAPKKGKKSKATREATMDLNDDDDGDDSNVMQRWTDPEVHHLIAFRSEMDDVFKQNAKKQGINTWEKLLAKMVAACEGFTKSAEACRKKWKVVYNQYCNDKRLLQISGEGRKITCKFFEEIDQGFNNAANVRKYCHGDARGNPNPCPPDLNDTREAQDSTTASPEGQNTGASKEASPQSSKAPKKSSGDQIISFMGDMVIHSKDMANSSRDMVTQTTRIADDIHQNRWLLTELQCQMGKLIEKL